MKFRVYPDAKSEWRWNLVADNGRKIADSGEGYKQRQDCLDAIDLVKTQAPTAAIEEAQQQTLRGRLRGRPS